MYISADSFNKSISTDALLLRLNDTKYMQHLEKNEAQDLYLSCRIYFMLSMENPSAKVAVCKF